MAESITPRQFHDAEGIEDWRVVFGGACTHFRTGSFAAGVALVNAIGDVAGADHHPDVDLRNTGVTVRLMSYEEVGMLSDRDIELARQISAAARRLNAPADPTAVQTVQVAIDTLAAPEVIPFWRAVLGYRELGEEDVIDPRHSGPSIWFQTIGSPQRDRIHIDVSVPHDQAEARIAAALAAGGQLVSNRFAPAWWTLADPEGNVADIATWMGRDQEDQSGRPRQG